MPAHVSAVPLGHSNKHSGDATDKAKDDWNEWDKEEARAGSWAFILLITNLFQSRDGQGRFSKWSIGVSNCKLCLVWPHFYFSLKIRDSTALPSLDMAMAMMVEMGDGGEDRLIDTNTFTFQHNTIYNI